MNRPLGITAMDIYNKHRDWVSNYFFQTSIALSGVSCAMLVSVHVLLHRYHCAILTL